MLAHRTSLFKSSGTAAARAAAKAASDAGKEIIDLTAGEIWADLAPTVREGAIDAIMKGKNRYTDTTGLVELREAIAAKVSGETFQAWSADEIAVTTGAKQALFNTVMALIDPGDEVIIPSPYWTTFPAQVLVAGGTPIEVHTRLNRYVPTLKGLKEAVRPRTRAIVVNTPNNPTGAVWDDLTLRGIAKLAIENDLWIVFDECYASFTYGRHRHHNILAVAPEVRDRTVIINAFSKSLALTGWRLGYLAAPKDVVSAIKALQSHSTSNPNIIAQYAVLNHLVNGDGGYERMLKEQLIGSRDAGLKILRGLDDVPLPKAQGGFYFYLDLHEILTRAGSSYFGRTVDDVANDLLGHSGVATVSGSAFGDSFGIRVSYGAGRADLERGLPRIVDALNTTRSPAVHAYEGDTL